MVYLHLCCLGLSCLKCHAQNQRMRIIQNEAVLLRRKTGRKIKLDKAGSEVLAERKDIDLRKTMRLVREAFTRALQTGELMVKLMMPKFEGCHQIGVW